MPAAITLIFNLKPGCAAKNKVPLNFQGQTGNEARHKIPDDPALIARPGRCDNLAPGLAIPDADQTAECKSRCDRRFTVTAPNAENGVGGRVGHRAFNELSLEGCKRDGFSGVRPLGNVQAMHELHSSLCRGRIFQFSAGREN